MSSLPAPSATASLSPNPTTPPYSDDEEWITAFLVIHMLSDPSRRYTYILWIIVLLVFVAFIILHWTGSRGGFIGAHWSKWSLRRRAWRKKHAAAKAIKRGDARSQPFILPSNAQLLCLSLLLAGTLVLSFVGPDYIAPGTKIWQWARSEALSNLRTRAGSFSPSDFYQFQPQYTISKAWWTSGGRTGLIAFALFPLCVLFALKAPPFAIFAIPFLIQLHFDKLAWLHRWSGRLIWFITLLHVVLWSVQLGTERRPGTGQPAYEYAWQYQKFIYGWMAFASFTLLIICSLFPMRRYYYDVFYGLHILLVPLTLVMSALHHPPVWLWCWIALALWLGERTWRAVWWLHTNGFFGGIVAPQQPGHSGIAAQTLFPKGGAPAPKGFSSPSSRPDHNPYDPVNIDSPIGPYSGRNPRIPHSPSKSHLLSTPLSYPSMSVARYLPPPGYAHAELLSGRTVRLRFVTPGFLSWAPGQHFLISIPSVSNLSSHPFTAASVCDEQASTDGGREIVLLIRAKQGWTKRLWDQVVTLVAHGLSHSPHERPPNGTTMPAHGVLMRMYIDGPFGSSARARWGNYSTILIVAGGSGVSFGLSILEYMCLCLAGRNGKYLGGRSGGWGMRGFTTTRVRFVWLVREFSHIQWCATVLRRCMNMIPSPGLQIDIFVTNFAPITGPPHMLDRRAGQSNALYNDRDPLPLPSPRFARDISRHARSGSRDSVISVDSADSGEVDLSYYAGEYGDEAPESHEDIHDTHARNLIDLTNFDGDNDTALPGEEALNRTVKTAGKVRRAKTRKAQKMTTPSHDQTSGSSHPRGRSKHTLSPSYTDASLISPHHRPPTFIDTDREYVQSNTYPPSAGEVSSSKSYPPSSPLSQISFGATQMSTWDDRASMTSSRALMPETGRSASGEEVKLELDEEEMHDVDVIAEHARPGKPRMERILADEVERSTGALIVACCGPTSLNSMMRKAVAAQIDPFRIRHGDQRGSIALVSEEFEF